VIHIVSLLVDWLAEEIRTCHQCCVTIQCGELRISSERVSELQCAQFSVAEWVERAGRFVVKDSNCAAAALHQLSI
jgi:hypothetical protein